MKFLDRGRKDRELTRELASYVDQETDDNIARGMTYQDARDAALRKLGNATKVRETVYEANSIPIFDHIWRDVRLACRQLKRAPAFTSAAIISLALGVGANTAIFQLVNALSLRPLPVGQPSELVEVRLTGEGRAGRQTGRNRQLSYAQWSELQRRQSAFSTMLAFADTRFNLSPRGEIRYVEGLFVSGTYFDTLGIRPIVGRLFTAADDPPAAPPGCGYRHAVISHAFWQREFGGRPDIITAQLTIGASTVPIIGVTPPDFFGLEVGRRFDVALPLCSSGYGAQQHWWLAAIGRLKPGWTADQAEAHLQTLLPAIQKAAISPTHPPDYVEKFLTMRADVVDARTGVSPLRRQFMEPLGALLAIAALVLLIATVNLANLMLARGTARQQEFAVRLAIGGSRRRVLQQVFTESLLLSGLGAAAAVLVAWLSTEALVGLISTPIDPIVLDLTIDWRVLGFTAAIAVAAAMLFGLAPAMRIIHSTSVSTTTRGVTGGREGFALRRALVVVQVAVTLVLLCGALLFLRSFTNLTQTETGVDKAGLVIANLFFPEADYPPVRRAVVYPAVEEQLRALPGVTRLANAFTVPLGGNFWDTDIRIDGEVRGSTNLNQVSADYFDVMGTRLLAGRVFDQRDTPSSQPVAVVSETFAAKYLGSNPLGRVVTMTEPSGGEDRHLTVIGIVQDQKYYTLREAFSPLMFRASSQEREPGLTQRLALRTARRPAEIIPAIKGVLENIDPSISVRFATMTDQIDASIMQERLLARMSGFFGVVALTLAIVGLYGVVAYMAARRRAEIGVRIARAAGRRHILWMMILDVTRMIVIGLAIGSALTWWLSDGARALLYEIEPRDLTTLALAAGLLAMVGFSAAVVPARHAARIDPVQALRES